MKLSWIAVAALAVATPLAVSGCASGTKQAATPEGEGSGIRTTASVAFADLPEMGDAEGRIVVYRTKAAFSLFGLAAVQPVALNGEPVGTSSRGEYFYLDLPAGSYKLSIMSPPSPILGCHVNSSRSVEVSIAEHDVAFVKTYTAPIVGLVISTVSAEDGQEGVDGLELQQTDCGESQERKRLHCSCQEKMRKDS